MTREQEQQEEPPFLSSEKVVREDDAGIAPFGLAIVINFLVLIGYFGAYPWTGAPLGAITPPAVVVDSIFLFVCFGVLPYYFRRKMFKSRSRLRYWLPYYLGAIIGAVGPIVIVLGVEWIISGLIGGFFGCFSEC
ncbi:MAG TPA: hypothetical protein VFF30_07125 [Nitrososphaerales archaeon]|nr:hypothetical protein [Nitrososphaerales archaeon]